MASQRAVPQNESPEELQQKAREFWKEIKDLKIPDATTGKWSCLLTFGVECPVEQWKKG